MFSSFKQHKFVLVTKEIKFRNRQGRKGVQRSSPDLKK